MHIEKRISKNRFPVDFVAYDKFGKPILFGWTRSMELTPESTQHLLDSLDASKSKIPFAMLADNDQMILYRKEGEEPAKLVWSSRSVAILNRYDPEFGTRRIFADYLRGLVESWLRDLAYHWKSATPPAQDEMATIGLLGRLEGGTTRTEVWLAGNPLS